MLLLGSLMLASVLFVQTTLYTSSEIEYTVAVTICNLATLVVVCVALVRSLTYCVCKFCSERKKPSAAYNVIEATGSSRCTARPSIE